MNGDPFERFERSRSGLLIPILIFIAGAVVTTFALSSLDKLVSLQGLADEPPAAIEPAAIEPAAIEPAIKNQLDVGIESAIQSDIENQNGEPSPQ